MALDEAGGIPYVEVARIPARYFISIELNDGTFKAPWDLHEDTINHKRLCGEGEFDVKRFIASAQKAGYTGPFGIEVLSQELRRKPLEELTTRRMARRWRNSAHEVYSLSEMQYLIFGLKWFRTSLDWRGK